MSLMDELNKASKAEFVERLGGIYEHSPWVAEAAHMFRPFKSLELLHQAMQTEVLAASDERQMALIRAHPELLGKLEAAQLTESSRSEQAGAGLDRCTAEEKARMQALNQQYRERFGFPFIVAVKGLDWGGIIERMQERMPNSREVEIATALDQIGRIAHFRLEALK
jgi:2-oxo-4-hydroxy-4-carboxy-5-ureidoimidazoline decarboxylase